MYEEMLVKIEWHCMSGPIGESSRYATVCASSPRNSESIIR